MNRQHWILRLVTVYLPLMFIGLLSIAPYASAQLIETVHSFANTGEPDSQLLYWDFQLPFPNDGGFFYGTATGYPDTIFRIRPNGTQFKTIHSFDCATDGCSLHDHRGGLIASGEYLYGTRSDYGTNRGGTIFRVKLKPDDTSEFEVIHRFQENAPSYYERSRTDGANPWPRLTQLSDGFLYGTTQRGGNYDLGALFRIRPDGSAFQILHDFSSGAFIPSSGLFRASDGLLYGTTAGQFSSSLYRFSPDGLSFSIVHAFDGLGNDRPGGGLLESDGFLYGAMWGSGVGPSGRVFKIRPDGSELSVIHSFQGSPGDGADPVAPLIKVNGNFYGVTQRGGAADCGTVFMTSPNGPPEILDSFVTTSCFPSNGLTQASDGHLYGTNRHSIFRVPITNPGQAPAITSSHSVTFTRGSLWTFLITTTGSPPPALAKNMVALPAGVTFTDNHDGTATLTGTATGTGAPYPLVITASNGISPNATQAFTLIVNSNFTADQGVVFGSNVTVGDGAHFSKDVFVGDNSTIGPNAQINQGVTIGPNAFIGDNSIIGKNTTVGDGAEIEANVQINQNDTLGPGVHIGSGTKIGRGTTVGANASIGSGLTIGSNVQVPVGAVVVANVTSNTIVPSPLVITTTSLSTAAEGEFYSRTMLTSGGTPAYTWSIIAGSLPNGLALTGATISGTPSTAGGFTFTVKVTDSGAQAVTKVFSINVASSSIPITTCPYRIETPGRYKLMTDCSVPAGGAVDTYGIAILASDVQLNLNNHTITGPTQNAAACNSPTDVAYGITVPPASPGFPPVTNAKISNGVIRNFRFGILFNNIGGHDHQVDSLAITASCIGLNFRDTSNNTVLFTNLSGNFKFGLLVQRSNQNTFRSNLINNNIGEAGGAGVYLEESLQNLIELNTISNNEIGLRLTNTSRGNTIAGNTLNNNVYGIYLDPFGDNSGNVILGNIASGNNPDFLDSDFSLPCRNTWTTNTFSTDNEGNGPGVGCIR